MSIFASRCGLLSVFLLLVSGSLFAQWDDSDRAVLERINARLSNLGGIANALIDPDGHYSLHSDVHTISEFTQGISGNVQTMRDDLTRIRIASEKLQFAVSGGTSHLLVQDDVSSNLLSSGNSELKALNRKFDSFLDYYSNNLQNVATVQPWLYTNLAWGIDFFLDFNVESSSSQYFLVLLDLYRRLTNNPQATVNDALKFWNIYKEFSPSKWHIFDALARISYANLPDEMSKQNGELYDELFKYSQSSGGFLLSSLDYLGDEYYYQYGTRELTATNQAILDAVRAFTNGVPFDTGSVVESSTTPSGTSFSLSRGVVSAAVGISQTFASNIDTNVVAVDTNSLVPLADNDFSGKLAGIDLDRDILSGPLDFINGSSLGDELEAVASSAPDTYTISVPSVSMLGGSTQAAEFHFANIRDNRFLVIVDVICGVLKFILFLVYGRSIVDVVANNLFAPG